MGNTQVKFVPNLKKIELCLTYRCNVKCANCSNLCTQAPAYDTLDLTTEDVDRFIGQSIVGGHTWDLITLHGGEPVLNYSIRNICISLNRYRGAYSPKTRISLLSNGSTDAILKKVRMLCEEFALDPGISEKVKSNHRGDGTPIPYAPVNISPADLGIPWTMGCFQTSDCGICLNKEGYWPCSPMAAAARVFGYKPMVKTMGELSAEALAQGFEQHCKHCGFAGVMDRVVEQKTSATWVRAFNEYKK